MSKTVKKSKTNKIKPVTAVEKTNTDQPEKNVPATA
jgi:hypothetical protein